MDAFANIISAIFWFLTKYSLPRFSYIERREAWWKLWLLTYNNNDNILNLLAIQSEMDIIKDMVTPIMLSIAPKKDRLHTLVLYVGSNFLANEQTSLSIDKRQKKAVASICWLQ